MLPRVIMSNIYRKPRYSEILSRLLKKEGRPIDEIIIDTLKVKFPKAHVIEVNDISGGCGAMFEVTVLSTEFEGLSTVKQHSLVNNALKEQIKNMHGIRINTEPLIP